MSQMKLIDSRDEWTVKELLETMHEKVNDLERKLDAQLKLNDSIQWHLHAIVLHLTGDRAALTAFVMGSEPTVVPNEDEAMPVLASCPQCDTKAYTEAGIADFFGWRTMADGKTIVQSWCRECRSSGKGETEVMPVVEPVIVQDEPSPRKRKKEPLPFHIADIGKQSRDARKQSDLLFKKAAAAAPKHQPELLRQAALAAETSAELLSEYDRQRGEYRPRIDNRTSRKAKTK
jgi:hypothetical protein